VAFGKIGARHRSGGKHGMDALRACIEKLAVEVRKGDGSFVVGERA
jgi:hypothetical protein